MTGERISWKLLRLKTGRNNNGRGRLVSSYQLNAHFLYSITIYICYIIILNMFRALPCSSSGRQIVLLQHLVSSLSVKAVQYVLLKVSKVLLETS